MSDEIILHCPKCSKEDSPKLYINPTLGLFNCFRCGFKGHIKKLYRYPNIISKLEDKLTLAEYAKLRSFKPLEIKNIEVLKDVNPVREISYKDLQFSYLLSRGWTEELIELYKPLISLNPQYLDRVILPIIKEDKIIYYTARSINSISKLKYKNPNNISRKNIIFKSLVPESVLYPKDLVILEGIFDAYKVPNGIGLLGKTISEENESQLLDLISTRHNIYICLDAGAESCIEDICKKIYSWFPSKNIFKINTTNYKGKDIGNLSETFNSIELFSWIRMNSTLYVSPPSLSDSIKNKIANFTR